MPLPALNPNSPVPQATLMDVTVGSTVRLGNTANMDLQLQLVRMGLSEGAILTLSAKIPKGPLVFQCGGTEIALGREFCQLIPIQPL